MQGLEPQCEGRVPVDRSLEKTEPLGCRVHPSLPAKETVKRPYDLGTCRQPFFHQGATDLFSLVPRGGGGRDLEQAGQEGILVSGPRFPSLIGTIPVRQPLLN